MGWDTNRMGKNLGSSDMSEIQRPCLGPDAPFSGSALPSKIASIDLNRR